VSRLKGRTRFVRLGTQPLGRNRSALGRIPSRRRGIELANLKVLGGLVVVLVLMVGILFLGARFHDGPLALIPGGPLVSGDLVTGPVADWTFATAVELIELQLRADTTSRTTWILVEDSQAYIPCSLGFPPGKNWHLCANADGRAVVRLLGKRYEVTLDRVENAPLAAKLASIVAEEYDGGPPGGTSTVWFFAMNPPSI
jgi:hypothetical protein